MNKILTLLIIIITIIKYNNISKVKIFELGEKNLNIYRHLNLTFQEMLKKTIRIGIYTQYLRNGGRARITSLLLTVWIFHKTNFLKAFKKLKYFCRVEIFDIYLLINKKNSENEYKIPKGVKRILIKKINSIYYLFKEIKKKKLDILIYQLSIIEEINKLNNLKKKIIFYQHQSLFYWIYSNYSLFKKLYKSYQNSKYVISLIPLENDYIFKKWGINSKLMENFITNDYISVIQSNLSIKSILMFGRGNNKYKRFEIGIQSMEYIIKEIPECDMKIITNTSNIYILKNIINSLNLKNKINFYEYISEPEIYFKNISLHIFPSISESFGLVLCETKIYGIPSILIGLDYIMISNNGTVIVYDDCPESISKEGIKILKNNDYKKKLASDARKSIKRFDNNNLLKKWIKLILSIYYDDNDNYYEQLRKLDKKISIYEAMNILKKEIKFLTKRKKFLNNITVNNIINFSFMESI